MIQRFQTSKSVKDSRQGFIINAMGDSVWTIGLSFVGLGLFAFYSVNPKPADLVANPDHTVPYFLRTMFPTGVLGLVLAATLAASLSSIASAINSCTTVTMVDFYERLFKRKKHVAASPETRPGPVLEYATPQESEPARAEGREGVMLSRVLTVCYGIIAIILAANVQRIGDLIAIAQKAIQTFTGPLLGIYLLGMFNRRATSRGALAGGIIGTAVAVYVAFFFKDPDGRYRIAFYWPTVIGFLVTFITGSLLSMVLGGTLSERAKELNWYAVMKRPLPEGEGGSPAPAPAKPAPVASPAPVAPAR
jgi:Na+/proline symporter